MPCRRNTRHTWLGDTSPIAAALRVRPATVSKWRVRYERAQGYLELPN